MFDEEYEDAEFESSFDALLAFLDYLPKETIKIIDFERYKTMMEAASELKDLLFGSNSSGKLEIDICDMFNHGSIKTTLDELTVMDTEQFANLIKKADNFEVYPRVDGKIQMNLSFQSVLRSVDGGGTI